jgi:hypothetical protein
MRKQPEGAGDDAPELGGLPERGGTSAEEDRSEAEAALPSEEGLGSALELDQDRVGVGAVGDGRALGLVAHKVTVGAFLQAIREVNVKEERLLVGSVRGLHGCHGEAKLGAVGSAGGAR